MDSDRNQLLVITGSSHEYSEEFIKNVLNGVEGRDLSEWCDIDVFSSYFMRTRDDVTNELKEIILDTERAKELINLIRPECWRKR